MADPLPRPTALLIGSWKYDPDRDIRGVGGESGINGASRVDDSRTRVDKKTNIKRVFTKDNLRVPDHAWVTGDLDNMESLIKKNNIELFHRLDYREKDGDGVWAEGKKEVLVKIDEFFQQQGRTHFVLYFSGHGNKDGSWCFALSTRANASKSRSNTHRNADVAAQTLGSGGATTFAAVEQSADVEVHAYTGARNTPSPVPKALDPDADAARDEEALTRIEEEYDIVGSDRPDPVKEWIELVKYEDVIELWDKNKMRRERYLMIILDCCHSGRWVQMVNGENIPEDAVIQQPNVEEIGARENGTRGDSNATGNAENTNAARPEEIVQQSSADESTTQGDRVNSVTRAARVVTYRKRNDVCIQAACRPTETCMVADNQYSSVFTRAFVAAQNRSFLEKIMYAFFDHAFVLNVISINGHRFTPMSSQYAPFSGIRFFDSFDDMYLKTH